MYMIGVIVTGFILDLFLGDPHWMPHPVRFIGNIISFLTKSLHKPDRKTKENEIWQGAILVIITAMLSFFIPLIILKIAGLFGTGVVFLVESIMAIKSSPQSLCIWKV